MANANNRQNFSNIHSSAYEICRLCGTTARDILQLNDVGENDLRKLLTKYQLQFPVGLQHSFRFCHRCLSDVRHQLVFRNMVNESISRYDMESQTQLTATNECDAESTVINCGLLDTKSGAANLEDFIETEGSAMGEESAEIKEEPTENPAQ